MHGTVTSESLILPPLLTGVAVEREAPFATATARAAEVGAGVLFHAERPGALAFALVLEPEVALAAARGVFPVAVAAVADALAAHGPPERAVSLRWPDVVVFDAGRIGGARLAWPEGAAEDAVPDWLVFAADLIRDRDDVPEPGRFPESTSLKEEGFEAPIAVIESFARHLMLRMDTWQARGHRPAAEGYLRRLEAMPAEGLALAATGDLVVRDAGAKRRLGLVEALAASDWYDPVRGGVRL